MDELYALTLAEENIYWDGVHPRLVELYRYVKSKYDVPVYQWYTPAAGTPGFDWPTLPADGWMLDGYSHRMPDYERFVREYQIHRVPLVSIIWAAPSMRDFDWEASGQYALHEQWKVHREWGIPSAFFCWSGKANIWGWMPDAPKLDASVFNEIRSEAERLAALPGPEYPTRPGQIGPAKAVSLVCDETNIARFSEDYTRNGGQLMRSSAIEGLGALRYRGQALEFVPSLPAHTVSSIVYQFNCAFPTSANGARLRVQGRRIDPTADAVLHLSVSQDGHAWSEAVAWDDKGIAEVKNLSFGDDGLWMKIELSGSATTADQVLIAIDGFEVETSFSSPGKSAIQLRRDVQSERYVYDGNLADMGWLHTADIRPREELQVLAGGFGHVGVKGRTAQLTLVQEFNAKEAVALKTVQIDAIANEPANGAVIRLGVSVDGSKPQVVKSTSGEFKGVLELDAALLAELPASKRFFVHVEFVNTSGTAGVPARLEGVRIEAN